MSYELFHRLRELDKIAAERWPPDFDKGIVLSGFDHIGLPTVEALQRNHCGWCTPLNCTTFVITGSDGVHYSFLLIPGQPTFDGPVIVTDPSNCGISEVIAENLWDFLCLGCQPGASHFSLSTAPSRPPETEKEMYSRNVGQEMITLIRDELGLEERMICENRFAELEKDYGDKIVYPPGFV